MISICIVSWNTCELLKACLRAIESNPPGEDYEVVVVDNASPDGSAQMVQQEFPQVRVLANSENLFYAKASNQALSMAKGELVMLLNPDTRVKEGCLTRLAAFLRSNSQSGAVAPRLLWPDGTIQSSCRSFPTPRAILLDMLGTILKSCRACGEYRMLDFKYDVLREVDQPMASAIMIKQEALAQIGNFDEAFPMFFNDVDLCLRIKQAGWKTFFLPEAEVVHHHGASTAQRKREMIIHSHDSLQRFYRKHYLGRVSWLSYKLVLLLSQLGKHLRVKRVQPRSG